MKKMLLKNWFWIIVLLVLGIKYGFGQGLQAVKKFDLPEKVLVKETEAYVVESVEDLVYVIENKNSVLPDRYYIDYQDYQDIIEFFYELVQSEPTGLNYVYETKGDNWSIEVRKTWNKYSERIEYMGTMSRKGNEKSIFGNDVEFLSSLPLDIWE